MAVSGSIDFNLVTNDLITEAFDLCGIGSEGEAIAADQYARARRSLNLIIKAWSANEHLWLKTETAVTPVASQANYALATLFSEKPLRVLSVRRRDSSGIDTPLYEMSRQDYDETPNKTTDSIPVSFYYDPQTTTGTLYLWPRPSTAFATSDTLRVTWVRRMDDFDGSSDDADLPQEWLQALSYALAEQLALKYGVSADIRTEIAARAAQYKAELEAWDNEPASLFLQPEGGWC